MQEIRGTRNDRRLGAGCEQKGDNNGHAHWFGFYAWGTVCNATNCTDWTRPFTAASCIAWPARSRRATSAARREMISAQPYSLVRLSRRAVVFTVSPIAVMIW